MLAKQTKIYSYQRISTTKQNTGVGIDRQNDSAEKWCEEKGFVLDRSLVLRDIGKSGGGLHKIKGVLGQFFKQVEAGKIPNGSYLLIDDFSRLSREEISIACEDFLKLVNAGINIVCLSDNGRVYSKDNLDLPNLMLSIMMMSRAYEENAFKKRNAKDNWQRKMDCLEKGEYISVKLPSWLKAIDRKTGTKRIVEGYKIVEDKAAIVRLVFSLRLKGYSIRNIAKTLNIQKVKTFQTSKSWADSQVKEILMHKSVIGTLLLKGYEKEGYFPTIIDKGDYDKVQVMWSEKIRSGGHSKEGIVVGNLFTGLAKCPICGDNLNKMSCTKGDYRFYYLTCYSYRRNGQGCTQQAVWEYKHFENLILNWISKELDVTHLLADDKVNQTEIDVLKRSLAEKEKRIIFLQQSVDNWFDALANYSGGNMKRYQETINGKIDSASDEMEQIKKGVEELTNKLRRMSVGTDQIKHQVDSMKSLIKLMNDGEPEKAGELRTMLQRELNNIIDSIIVYSAGNPDDKTPDEVRFAGMRHKQGHKNWNHLKRYVEIRFKSGQVKWVVPVECAERFIEINTVISHEDQKLLDQLTRERRKAAK